MQNTDTDRRPRFCTQCGTALPAPDALFCIECGHTVAPWPDAPPHAAVGATVRLSNARVEQSVIGGTVRLPSSGAVPPGLWIYDEPPGPADVVAIYAPLRAVVGGWSGLRGRGWETLGSEARGTRMYFHFAADLEWFPAPGCGRGLRLRVQVEARSSAQEGRERHGFRYSLERSGPMTVREAAWHDADGNPAPTRPLPQIQLMAPPRVLRISDYDDIVEKIAARDGVSWAGDTLAPGLYRPYSANLPAQEHTPAGRGITLIPQDPVLPERRGWLMRILTPPAYRYRARVRNPFRCTLAAWNDDHLPHIRAEAAGLGLDLEPATAAEWWLDRHGYDAVIFSAAHERYKTETALIVFRRNQIAQESLW
jgi:hypothetical protein